MSGSRGGYENARFYQRATQHSRLSENRGVDYTLNDVYAAITRVFEQLYIEAPYNRDSVP